LVGECFELVRGLLQFSSCELLLLEASSWSTGTFQETRARQMSTTGNHYQIAGEGTTS
jgi:hypothetical protein